MKPTSRLLLLGGMLSHLACCGVRTPVSTAPRTKARRAKTVRVSKAVLTWKPLVARLQTAQRKGKEVDLKKLLAPLATKLPDGCDVKAAKVHVVATPKGLTPAVDRFPGALLLVVPVDWSECAEAQGPSLCAISVAPGKPGQADRLLVSEPDLGLGGNDKVLSAKWGLRPNPRALLTLRHKAESTNCQGADSEYRRSLTASIIRYEQGRFSLLQAIDEKSLVRPGGSSKELTSESKWAWRQAQTGPHARPFTVLAVIVKTTRPTDPPPSRFGPRGGDDDEGGNGGGLPGMECSRTVEFFRFDLGGAKLIEIKGPARKKLHEAAGLEDYANLDSNKCELD